jgi:serine/threonine-protein kinase
VSRLIVLFERALDVPPERRTEFFQALRGGDAALREELASLLEAHQSAPDYFDHLASELSPTYTAIAGAARERGPQLQQQLQESLGNSYQVAHELGGGMSRVFLADEIKLGRKVVIKVLPPEMAASASAERFRREIQIAAQLQHPHIVPLLTSDSTASLLYYTMPFVAGESLRARLARDGALPLEDARQIWRDVLDALAYAHASGVIHRDIKPGNILLSGRSALVTDFGIARAIEAAGDANATAPELAIGTPAYMAPEQVDGNRTTDHRVDIYAAGLLMYEMLEGRLPFSGESAREVVLARLTSDPAPVARPDCPPDLAVLVARCLSRAPEGRPRTAEALLGQLEAIPRTGDGAAALPLAVAGPTLRRRIAQYALAAAVVAALALGAIELTRTRVRPVAATASRDESSVARPIARRYTPTIEAYEWYLRGMDMGLMRTAAGRKKAIEYFKRAIAADSTFAAAYAALAIREMSEPTGNHLAGAELAASKAIALDDSLAESHAALGWVRLVQWNWASSEAEFDKAIALDRNAPRAFEGLARLYLFTGRPAEQLAAAQAGLAVDPFSHSAMRELALALSMNGRCDEAIERLEPLKALSPPARVAGVIRGVCYAAKQMWPEAIAEFHWSLQTSEARTAPAFLGYALARAGKRDSAMSILSDLLSGRTDSHGAFGIATVYAGLGNYDSAFVWLDRAVEERTVRPYLMGPMFDDLRRDPRFSRVKARMGL